MFQGHRAQKRIFSGCSHRRVTGDVGVKSFSAVVKEETGLQWVQRAQTIISKSWFAEGR